MANNITGLGIGSEQPITRSEDYARELETAMSDILHDNKFLVHELGEADVNVTVHKEGQNVVFCVQIADEQSAQESVNIYMPTKPLRSLMKDYFLMVESYQQAIKSHDTRKIEAVDMGRRGMHNEGAEMITDMLEDKVKIDFNTARRLFTLVAILHMK